MREKKWKKCKGPFAFFAKKTACFQEQAVFWKQAVLVIWRGKHHEKDLLKDEFKFQIFRNPKRSNVNLSSSQLS